MRARKFLLIAVVVVAAVAAARVLGLWVGGQFLAPPTVAIQASPPNPRSISVNGGIVLVGRNEPFRLLIPVRNETGKGVRFNPPGCGCGCQKPSWDRDTLAAGGETTLVIETVFGSTSGPTEVACSWTSDDEHEWSARWTGNVLLTEGLADVRLALGGVSPDATIRREVRFVQHASTADELPPAPIWKCDNPHVRLLPPVVTVDRVGEVARRTSVVPVEVSTGTEAGTFWAVVSTDRGPEGVEVSWKIVPEATVTPHTWVVSASDFATDKPLQHTFRVQADGRKVTAVTPSANLRECLTAIAFRDTDSVSLTLTRPSRTVVGEVEVTLDPPTRLRVLIPVAFVAP